MPAVPSICPFGRVDCYQGCALGRGRRVPVLAFDKYGETVRLFSFRILHPRPADLAVILGRFSPSCCPTFVEAAFFGASLPDGRGRFCALICRRGDLTAGLFDKRRGNDLGYHGPFGQGWPSRARSLTPVRRRALTENHPLWGEIKENRENLAHN